jgi:acetate---CoA ligase (ADP-forming)
MVTFDDLFAPKSVAIVGASDDPRRIGGRPLAAMLKHGFAGQVYPVNARRRTVQGVRCYSSLLDIEAELDFVLSAVPAAETPAVVRQAVAKKAKAAVILSAGFAEAGAEGARLQAELVALSREAGLRIVGPNCLGLFNAATRFFPTFTATLDRALPKGGGVAIASQSGAFGSHLYLISHLHGLGVGQMITTGNEADFQLSEAIEMFATHDGVHVIMAYSEGVKDEARFANALETARSNRKPVIVMKVGRSPEGAAAAALHTASVAGDDTAFDALIRRRGALRVRSAEEMVDIAYACQPRIYPAGKRLGIVTISGGAGALIADNAQDHGLEVPAMPEAAQAKLKAMLPFAATRNPVDVTAQFFNDLTLIPRFTRTMLDEGAFDGLIGFWTSIAGSPVLGLPLLAHLRETMAGYPGRIFIHSIVAGEDIRRQYEEAGFPCFEDPGRAVAAMAALMHFGLEFAKGGARER